MDEQEINKKYYNENAKYWTAAKTNSFFHERSFPIFCRYLAKGSKILDIGCANGIVVPLFLGIGRKFNLKYEGLDISAKFLEVAKTRYPRLKFYEADILNDKS